MESGGKKILVVIPDLKDIGGVASYYNSVLPLLERDEFHIDCLEIGSTKGKGSILYPLSDQYRFNKSIKNGPSIVHINPSLNLKSFIRDGLFVFQAKRYKIPVIVFFHGWERETAEIVEKFFLRIFLATYGQADSFIVLAEEFRKKLLSWNISAQIYLETTAIDQKVIEGFDIEKKVLDLKRKGPLRVLFLARLERDKGIFETIDAVILLIKRRIPVTLSIAGDGSKKSDLEKYVKQLNIPSGSIRFLGYVTGSEKIAAFTNHDLYCFPSYGEGLPISVLEALAFGMLVITCSVGGIADIFHDGEMGALVPMRDAEAIAKKIEQLISDRESMSSMAKNNHAYAKRNFLAPKVARRLLEIYRQTLGH